MSLTPHLGIDFGGVIVPMLDTTRRGERPFSGRFLARSPHEGAFEKIRSLGNVFGGKIWIVSKADEQTESLTRQWLSNKGFWELTGLEESYDYSEMLPMYILATREQWKSLSKHRFGDQADIVSNITAGGYSIKGVSAFWDIGFVPTLSVAGHEGLHQFFYFRLQHRIPPKA